MKRIVVIMGNDQLTHIQDFGMGMLQVATGNKVKEVEMPDNETGNTHLPIFLVENCPSASAPKLDLDQIPLNPNSIANLAAR